MDDAQRRSWRRIRRAMNPPKRCNGKICYDKKGAQTAKNGRYKRDRVRLRIYPCPDCRAWHLTSQL